MLVFSGVKCEANSRAFRFSSSKAAAASRSEDSRTEEPWKSWGCPRGRREDVAVGVPIKDVQVHLFFAGISRT